MAMEPPMRLPHPIPYQGSKRNLVRLIAKYIPQKIETWYEPFACSAAMTLWAASKGVAKKYVIGESLIPIAELWQAILQEPALTAKKYETLWRGQRDNDFAYFNH